MAETPKPDGIGIRYVKEWDIELPHPARSVDNADDFALEDIGLTPLPDDDEASTDGAGSPSTRKD